MRNVKLAFLSVLFFCISTCYVQILDVKIQKENDRFLANGQLIENLNYTIMNELHFGMINLRIFCFFRQNTSLGSK